MQLGQALPRGHNASTVECAELECVSLQLLDTAAALQSLHPMREELLVKNMEGGKKSYSQGDAGLFYLVTQSGDDCTFVAVVLVRGASSWSWAPLSTEQLLKAWLHHLQVFGLHLLRKALDVQDGLVSLVEQLRADLLLHPVSPGAQLREALEHIQASSDRLRIGIRLPLTCTSLLFFLCVHVFILPSSIF